MYCVMWTYVVPKDLTKPAITKLFLDVADRYLGIPGLIRKYFGFTEEGKEVIGIYLWTSKTAADEFYSPSWIKDVTQRWGAVPRKSEWIVPVVAESAEGKLMRDHVNSADQQ